MWAAAAAVILSATLVVFANPAADTDLWGHLLFGQHKLETGVLERVDRHSFTAAGEAWVNHEWLAEVVGATVYRLAGDRGLVVGKLLIGFLIGLYLVVLPKLRGGSPVVVAAVGLVVVYGLFPGTMFRPQLFSYLLYASLLGIVHLLLEGRPWLALLLPVVMGVWANLHGGFPVGLALLGVVGAWQLARWVRGEDPLVRAWPVLAGCAAGWSAVLATPYGLELPRFLASSLSRGRPIGEWAPLPLLSGGFPEIKVVAALAIVLAAAALLGGWRGWHGWELAMLAATVVATLRHQRHAPFLLLTAAPFIAWALAAATDAWGRRRSVGAISAPGPRALVTAALLVTALVQAAVAAHSITMTRGRVFVDPTLYPVTAVRFLVAQSARGRLVLPFEWGEYAIWHLGPRCTVSIDGRYETVYPEPVRDAHFRAAVDPRVWEELADQWQADLLLAPAVPEVLEIAERRPEQWSTVWVDAVAAVLVRRDGAAAGLASQAVVVPGGSDERPLTAFP